MEFEKIVFVNASDFPDEVTDYCVDREISTHYQHDVAYIEDDGNPFAEWLKSNGFDDWEEGWPHGAWIAIFST